MDLRYSMSVFSSIEKVALVLTDTAYHFDESFPLTQCLAARLIGATKNLVHLCSGSPHEKQKSETISAKVLLGTLKESSCGSIIESDTKRKFREGYEWF